MKLNFIAFFYWKRVCKIKSFDLSQKKHRLLVVIFWLIAFTSITAASYFCKLYIEQKSKYNYNQEIISEYEARFPLDRFLDNFIEDCKILQQDLQDNKSFLIDYIIEDIHPENISEQTIFNTFQKVLTQIINQDIDLRFTSEELAVFNLLQKHHQKKFDYEEYNIPYPNNNILHNVFVFFMLETNLVPVTESDIRYDYLLDFEESAMELADASLLIEANIYTDSLENIKYAPESKFNFSPDYIWTINEINLDNLSTESAKIISSHLPANYQIEHYFASQQEPSNFKNNGVRYVPSFLVDPFTKLTFFEPENFIPEDLESNLKWSKTMNNSILNLGYHYLLYIAAIIALNIFLIYTIRIINWIQNG